MMKKVLITGGSRGIGRACVEYFSKLGYAVAFIYRSNDSAAEEVARVSGAFSVRVDISRPEEAADAVRNAVEYLGGLDVLVNNAGISQIKLFGDITDGDWERMISANLSGAFYVSREALKTMISRHSGRIINIGSMWGKTGAACEVHYSASKAGLRGMTMALAKEVGPSGITVNCIEPGVVATDMNSALDEEELSALRDETPLGRIAEPLEIAYLAEFLASDKAGFITGQIIGIDGGYAV